jgi:hypothetical protein
MFVYFVVSKVYSVTCEDFINLECLYVRAMLVINFKANVYTHMHMYACMYIRMND